MITPNKLLDKSCFLNITPKEDNKEQEEEIFKVARKLASYCYQMEHYTFPRPPGGSWHSLEQAAASVDAAMCERKEDRRQELIRDAEDYYKRAERHRPQEWDEGTCMQATYQVVTAARDLVDREAAQ